MEGKDKRIELAIISGAAHALKYLEENPRATEGEVLNYINSSLKKILYKIGNEY